MSEYKGIPRALFRDTAKEMLAQFERCEGIRRVDGDRNVDRSTHEVWLIVDQFPTRWRAKSIEPFTMHGELVCYGHSEVSVAGGAECKMQALKMLIQGGQFHEHERDKCLEYICDRIQFRVAETRRL